VDLAARHLPAVCGFFIIGLPGATPTSDLAALDWARLHRVRAYFSHYVPGPMAPEGGLFFGSAAAPRSRAYPVEEQRRVYATARHAIRASYITRGLFRRVAGATLRSIRHYDARSWVNHLRHLAGRGWKLLRTGDLQ
jgi:radical SAM superfamily enzyme YgiQ (UPF0313 family)